LALLDRLRLLADYDPVGGAPHGVLVVEKK
jgi:hypothetical protein